MVDTDDTRRTTDVGRRTTDDGRRTTPRVWHKLPTGELKTKSGFRNFYKKLLLMNTCFKQVKIINLCAPNNNLLHEIPIPSFFQAVQKGRD